MGFHDPFAMSGLSAAISEISGPLLKTESGPLLKTVKETNSWYGARNFSVNYIDNFTTQHFTTDYSDLTQPLVTNTIILRRLGAYNEREKQFGYSVPSLYYVDWSIPLGNDKVRKEALKQFELTLGSVSMIQDTLLFLPFQLPTNEITLEGFHPSDPTKRLAIKITFAGRAQRSLILQKFFGLMLNQIFEEFAIEGIKKRNDMSSLDMILEPKNRLTIWPGLLISVTETPLGVTLLLDSSFSTLSSCINMNGYWNLMLGASANGNEAKAQFEKFIVGSYVQTIYDNRNKHKIVSVDWTKSPLTNLASICPIYGEEKLCDVYRTQHGIIIQDLLQPLLIAREDSQEYYLIPELCLHTGVWAMPDSTSFVDALMNYTGSDINTGTMRWRALEKFMNKLFNSSYARFLLGDWKLDMDIPRPIIDGLE